jgi:hypothetical protein
VVRSKVLIEAGAFQGERLHADVELSFVLVAMLKRACNLAVFLELLVGDRRGIGSIQISSSVYPCAEVLRKPQR